MQRDPGIDIARLLTLGRIEPNAADALAELYREASEVIESQRALGLVEAEQRASEAAQTPGIASTWLFFQTLSVFAEGIAVGRGRTNVTPEDVHDARGFLCVWPDCPIQRVRNALEALPLTAEFLGYEPLR